jgi:hypothetical protein
MELDAAAGIRAYSETRPRDAFELAIYAGELYGTPRTQRSFALEQNGTVARDSPAMAAAAFGSERGGSSSARASKQRGQRRG